MAFVPEFLFLFTFIQFNFKLLATDEMLFSHIRPNHGSNHYRQRLKVTLQSMTNKTGKQKEEQLITE